MLSGVFKYMDTPYQRSLPEAPVIWQRGSARLLDYGENSSGNIVLFVPSLINRYYILDLEEKNSFLRFLSKNGVYPLVLDWGIPSETEGDFNCADYVTKIMNPAIDYIVKMSGQSVSLAGYCMGGVLAMAAARTRAEKISSLALLATPWDFHAPEFRSFILENAWQGELEKHINTQKILPAEVILSLFYITNPFLFEQKFRRYNILGENSEAAKNFLALEHWVNDGVPMARDVAQDSFIAWAQKNELALGNWKVAGRKVTPQGIKHKTFIAIPKKDNVVPPACAAPLARHIPHAEIIRPSAGHVGMIVGSKAKSELWLPYLEWLKD